MSKELKVWYLLRDYLDKYATLHLKDETHIESVEGHSLDIIEKGLKALEIIKKKRVNVGVLIHHITDKHLLGLESYNFMWGGTPERQLTQEEYDLLREELL